jgi:hypothetical protein
MGYYLVLVNKLPASVHVRGIGICEVYEIVASFVNILPNYYFSVYCARHNSSQLLVTGDSSDSITVFAMHFVLPCYDVVFYDFSAPKTTDEDMLAPKRADWKFIHIYRLIKDVNKLEFVYKYFKMQRRSDGKVSLRCQLFIILILLILKDNTPAISTQDQILFV